MNAETDALFQSALRLPKEQQLALVDALVAAVAERGLRPFHDSWIAEAQRRWKEHETGQTPTFTWEEVKEFARQEAEDDV